jgi:deoxyribodipyrimidine photo-lyase
MRRMHQSQPSDDPMSSGLEGQTDLQSFEPTRSAALARLGAVDPGAYARTRNALSGAVTGLSPYLTHGFLSLPEVLAHVQARTPLEVQHKFVYELGWRAFFRHVWHHRGEGILSSFHDGPLPDGAYAKELPDDIRLGCTGVPVVDRAVQRLLDTGYLHNHARMWLASYVIHLRKVHWRAGADWLYAHLLDGDLASNHLSWQWVAGTGSHKPYLFNADNVARFAPPDWHSPGTVVDTSYEALSQMAEHPRVQGAPRSLNARLAGVQEVPVNVRPPAAFEACRPAPGAPGVEGRDVCLVHPWSLGERPAMVPADARLVAWLPAEVHRHWPWSDRRWQFVGRRMAELTDVLWWGDTAEVAMALARARRVFLVADPHLPHPLPQSWVVVRESPLFPEVMQPCASFSQWWRHATRGMATADQLLAARTEA